MRQTATPEAPEITISEWASKPSPPNMSAGGRGTGAGAGAGQGAGGKYGSTDEKGGGEKPEQVRAHQCFLISFSNFYFQYEFSLCTIQLNSNFSSEGSF